MNPACTDAHTNRAGIKENRKVIVANITRILMVGVRRCRRAEYGSDIFPGC
jgi:hypothetical protein